ncbi:MAG: undecaprenyl-diphosphate phosphatase [Candidatus Thorarchaeota archaeon]|jgi:undecaprenyl-diphosphatase
MEPWQIIVALIQGLVEWLPISSEGQVVLFVYNIGAVPQSEIISLVAWLHLGTTLAVLARYPRAILEILTLKDRTLFRLLLIATVSTAVTAIPFYLFLKESLSVIHGEILNIIVGGLLLVTAIILYLPTRETTDALKQLDEPGDREATVTGLVQGFAVLPGLSRSGVTISALLMQKVDRETALRFSFLMSVPAVIGILIVEVLTGNTIPPSIALPDLVLMEIIVFITGLLSMETLLRLARHVSFWKLCLILALVAIGFGVPALF